MLPSGGPSVIAPEPRITGYEDGVNLGQGLVKRTARNPRDVKQHEIGSLHEGYNICEFWPFFKGCDQAGFDDWDIKILQARSYPFKHHDLGPLDVDL